MLDIKIDSEKHLILSNRGLLDVEDISTRFTEYHLSDDYPRHISKVAVLSYSVMGGEYVTVERMKAGSTTIIDLKTKSTAVKFYSELPQPADEWWRSVYCLRFTFRNSVTKQRFVRYLLTSPSVELPDPWSASERAASGGGVDTSTEIIKIRDVIRAHQAAFFEDRTDDFFSN